MRFVIALALMVQPAAADIFDDLTGAYESVGYDGETCADNPTHVAFAPDRSRILVTWAAPVDSYTGARITAFGGTVVAVYPDGLLMLRDNETRVTDAGTTVLWVLRQQPQGFCWTRQDWTDGACLMNLRCEAEANS